MMLKIIILEESFFHFLCYCKLDKVGPKTIVLFSQSNRPQKKSDEIIVTEESIIEDTKTIYENYLDENDDTKWYDTFRW